MPLQNLGPLVLGNDSLNLQQQLLLRRRCHRVIEEHDFHASSAKFLDQEHLERVLPGQPVRRMHVETIDRAGSRLIPQSLKSRPLQSFSRDAVVAKAKLDVELHAFLRNSLLDRAHLAVDGVRLCLLLGGDPRVKCNSS
jgi:hypothetical protein